MTGTVAALTVRRRDTPAAEIVAVPGATPETLCPDTDAMALLELEKVAREVKSTRVRGPSPAPPSSTCSWRRAVSYRHGASCCSVACVERRRMMRGNQMRSVTVVEKPPLAAVTMAAAAPFVRLASRMTTHPPPPATDTVNTEGDIVEQPPPGSTTNASPGDTRGVPCTA